MTPLSPRVSNLGDERPKENESDDDDDDDDYFNDDVDDDDDENDDDNDADGDGDGGHKDDRDIYKDDCSAMRSRLTLISSLIKGNDDNDER